MASKDLPITCPHCASTNTYNFNSPTQQRGNTCKKCRKTIRIQIKNHQVVRVWK